MKVNIRIKKATMEIHAQNASWARVYFMTNFSNYHWVSSSKAGYHLMNKDYTQHVVYSMEVFKRGKYRKHKKYVFTYYFIPDALFNFITIRQYPNYFKITSKTNF